jgi:hypothetical protein
MAVPCANTFFFWYHGSENDIYCRIEEGNYIFFYEIVSHLKLGAANNKTFTGLFLLKWKCSVLWKGVEGGGGGSEVHLKGVLPCL